MNIMARKITIDSGSLFPVTELDVSIVDVVLLNEVSPRDCTYGLTLHFKENEGANRIRQISRGGKRLNNKVIDFSIKINIRRIMTQRAVTGVKFDHFYPQITFQPSTCQNVWLYKVKALSSIVPQLNSFINNTIHLYHKQRRNQDVVEQKAKGKQEEK